MSDKKEEPKIPCPLCSKDMSIRPGMVYRCDREVCAFWRFGTYGQQVTK